MIRAEELFALRDRAKPLPYSFSGIGAASQVTAGTSLASAQGVVASYLSAEDAAYLVAAANNAPALATRVWEFEAMLARLEWRTCERTGRSFCPECNASRRDGHHLDCRLFALLPVRELFKPAESIGG